MTFMSEAAVQADVEAHCQQKMTLRAQKVFDPKELGNALAQYMGVRPGLWTIHTEVVNGHVKVTLFTREG